MYYYNLSRVRVRQRPHCLALAALNSQNTGSWSGTQRSACFCPARAEIKGLQHHAQPLRIYLLSSKILKENTLKLRPLHTLSDFSEVCKLKLLQITREPHILDAFSP